MLFLNKRLTMHFPCRSEYIYAHRTVPSYCLDNIKSFDQHKNVDKETVCLETRVMFFQNVVVSFFIKRLLVG